MKNISLIIIGILLGAIAVLLIKPKAPGSEYFTEKESKYSFEETVAQLEATVAETSGWKILHTYDLQKSMEKNGYKVLQAKVFSLCNPEYASKILFSNQERVVSSMMPCRVSVYVKQNGKTYVSTMNSADMAARIGGLVEEVMSKADADVARIINDLLKE